MTDIQRYLEIATMAASEAGQFIRSKWPDNTGFELKPDRSLVTEIDLGSETLLREILGRHAPDVAILGEEQGATQDIDAGGLWWYVDPVDGTTNLAHRFPWVCVSIALMHNRQPLVGVVYNPILEHFFAAARGKGTTLNGSPVHVSGTPTLQESLLATGFAVGSRQNPAKNNLPLFEATMDHCQAIRRPGSAALDLACVAAGWIDGFWELGLHAWDTAAGWLLVEEAGGRVSTIDGQPFDSHEPQILATNTHIHDELGGILSTARKGML